VADPCFVFFSFFFCFLFFVFCFPVLFYRAFICCCSASHAFPSPRLNWPERLAAASFLEHVVTGGDLPLQMFVACRGWRALATMAGALPLRVVSVGGDGSGVVAKPLALVAVDCILRVFGAAGLPLPTGDVARLFADAGLIDTLGRLR
jgi:hypothetical protein